MHPPPAYYRLMRRPILEALGDKRPVRLAATLAERLAPLHHDEEDGGGGHADEGGRDEAVLDAQIGEPGCYPDELRMCQREKIRGR